HHITVFSQRIGQSANQWIFRPDHNQIGPEAIAQYSNGGMIVRRNRIALGEIGDSRISRRSEHFRLLRKLPRECVLSSARSDNEKSDLLPSGQRLRLFSVEIFEFCRA